MVNTVILIDDNAINSRLMGMFMEQSGYKVKTQATLDRVEQAAAVFVHVSTVKDKEAVRSFIKGLIDTPVIAVVNNDDEISNAEECCFTAIIKKPVSMKLMNEAIQKSKLNISAGKQGGGGCATQSFKVDTLDLDSLGAALGLPDKNLLKTIFTQYFVSTAQDIFQMPAALEEGDYDKLRNLAHSVKGSSRNMRLVNMGDMAEELEYASKAEDKTKDFPSMIRNITQHFKILEENFKKL